jgi:hypothetical protein
MEATVDNHPTVVNFKRICVIALRDSKLTLAGHVSSKAFQSALNTVVSTRTGISISRFGLGGQFDSSERFASLLPPGFLIESRRHLSTVTACDFFRDPSHLASYEDLTGDKSRPAAAKINLSSSFTGESATPSLLVAE